MNTRCTILVFLVVSMTAISQAEAQKLVYSRARPTVITTSQITAEVENRLRRMGYSNITLKDHDGLLAGSAMKGKRSADIKFDSKGQLHIEMKSGTSR